MRGALGRRPRATSSIYRRFIPAHAGSTLKSGRKLCLATVHPRACGEHDTYTAPRSPHFGSSPRMRGARSRGRASSADSGSSPRMRGALRNDRASQLNGRFIPAHAGSTFLGSRARSGRFIPAHAGSIYDNVLSGSSPRMRGAPFGKVNARIDDGSSPRMRGARYVSMRPNPHFGSSPRMRGARAPGGSSATSAPVHPRACGEHARERAYFAPVVGSSPRMRGAVFSSTCKAPGSSPRMRGALFIAPSAVHPRACGEQPMPDSLRDNVLDHGSSPRMRGAQLVSNR